MMDLGESLFRNDHSIYKMRPLQKLRFCSNSRLEWKFDFKLPIGNEEVNF